MGPSPQGENMAPAINSKVMRSSTKILETASSVSDMGERRAGALVEERTSFGMEVVLLCSIWAKRGRAVVNKTVNRRRVSIGIRVKPDRFTVRCTYFD